MTTRTPLENVELPGVSKGTIEKLAKAGITTVESLAVTPPREVVTITGMGIETAEKATRIALGMVGGFISADVRLASESVKPKISLGCSSLDNLMEGGIATGEITELIGEFSSGKSQICFTLCATVQQPPFNGEVVVVDTENTAKPSRILEVCKTRGLGDDALTHVLIAKAYNSDHETILIKSLPSLLTKNPKIRLVIVDSIIGHFREEYIGRGTLSDRQGRLASILGTLLRISQAFDVAVVITNQMMAVPDAMYGADPNKPAGGHIVAHAGTQRLRLRKGKDNKRVAKLIDSPDKAMGEAAFMLTEAGVANTEEERKDEKKEVDEK
jgi:DNA repair protein RadA